MFNFDTNSVVVWNMIASNEIYLSKTTTVIDMQKASIAKCLDQPERSILFTHLMKENKRNEKIDSGKTKL